MDEKVKRYAEMIGSVECNSVWKMNMESSAQNWFNIIHFDDEALSLYTLQAQKKRVISN